MRKCGYPECMKHCRTMCVDCNIAFCYPLQNFNSCNQDDICIIKHVHQITRMRPRAKKRNNDVRFTSSNYYQM